MKRTLIAVCLALILAAAMPQAASAQAKSATDIDIIVEPIIVLHYFAELDVTIDSASLASFLAIGPSSSEGSSRGTVSLVGSEFDVDVNIIPTDPVNNPASANLVLRNAWAVRALADPGTEIGMTGDVTGATLGHSGLGSEFIGIQSAAPSPASFAPPGLSAPQYGDITLNLDLTNATAAGLYNEGGEYTLTADFI